jgi:hypothetical protein
MVDLATPEDMRGYEALYERPLRATRTGPLYNAFSYPTKISPEAVGIFIAMHTRPGEAVLDPFAGSGTIGVGAMLCDGPTDRMVSECRRLILDAQWGCGAPFSRRSG